MPLQETHDLPNLSVHLRAQLLSVCSTEGICQLVTFRYDNPRVFLGPYGLVVGVVWKEVFAYGTMQASHQFAIDFEAPLLTAVCHLGRRKGVYRKGCHLFVQQKDKVSILCTVIPFDVLDRRVY